MNAGGAEGYSRPPTFLTGGAGAPPAPPVPTPMLSDLVESSGYSSKTLQKGSCPYAPLDEVLQ